jgi:hypothetical protein
MAWNRDVFTFTFYLAEIRKQHRPNTSLRRYRYASLLCSSVLKTE